MALRMGLGILMLVVLHASWMCDARQLMGSETLRIGSDLKNNQVCTLCETYATQAIEYLSQNKTQEEVLDLLHTSCSRLRSFEDECVTLVDYYAPLFFLEISTIQPEQFCEKVNLCEAMAISLSQSMETIIAATSATKLSQKLSPNWKIQTHRSDPMSSHLVCQLDIIEILLRGCASLEKKFVKQCKRMVFEYGPLILTNGAKFLEKNDLCTTLHACNSKVSSI